MTIKEQIEIARLIASGTPREVAISESRVTSSAIEKSGPTIDVSATEVKTPQQQSIERDRKRKEIAKEKRENKITQSPDGKLTTGNDRPTDSKVTTGKGKDSKDARYTRVIRPALKRARNKASEAIKAPKRNTCCSS